MRQTTQKAQAAMGEAGDGRVKNPLFAGYKGVVPGSTMDGTEAELRGSDGFIMSYDADTLAVYVIGAQRIRKLRHLSGAVAFAEGDGEATFHVGNAQIHAAAEVIGAKKRRVYSDEYNQKLAERVAAHRFQKKTDTD